MTLNKRGFTLTELLLYIGISSIVLTATSAFLQYNLRASVRADVRNQVDQQLLHATDVITTKLRSADSISVPATGSNGGTLTFLPTGASVLPTVISLAGSSITISENGSAPVPLTGSNVSVDVLSFQNLSYSSTPGTVRVTITGSYVSDGASEYQYSRSLTTSASLRR